MENTNISPQKNQDLIEIYKKMLFVRYFEKEIIKGVNRGLIKCPVYLGIGQESIAASVSHYFKPDLIFAQHRANSYYLSFGGDVIALIDELLGRTSGCTNGKGGSVGIQDEKIGMIGHHGLTGENVPLAVGAALGDKTKKVLCVLGDGTVEEDYVIPAITFAFTNKLPILFICEDNNFSILTKKIDRRNWELTDMLKSIGMNSVDITDDPNEIAFHINKMKDNLPAFLNCRTDRHHWHVGVGVDNPPEKDRLSIVKEELLKNENDEININKINLIEEKIKKEMEDLWEKNYTK